MKIILRVLSCYKGDAGRIALATALLVLSTALNLLKPWPLALLIDSLLGGQPMPAWLQPWTAKTGQATLLMELVGALLAVHILQALLFSAHTYSLISIGLRGLARIRNRLFDWLLRLSLRYHQGASQGDLIYRASWDTYAFHTLFQQGLFTLLSALLLLIPMIAVMWSVNPPLTLAALCAIPPLLLVIKFMGAGMSRRSLAAHDADGRVTSLVQESIAALPLTQSYVREDLEERRFSSQVAEALRSRLAQHGTEVAYLAAVAAVFAAGLAAVVWMGAGEVWAGHLTVGRLWVFLAYLGQFYEPLNQLSNVGRTLADASAGARRVFEILDTPEEVKEAPHARPVVSAQDKSAPSTARTGANPVVLQGHIEFQNVSFAYQPGRPVLRGINLQIEPGECLVLAGPSGAGKTTLLHLLPRFFDPDAGAVLFEGVDARQLCLKDMRRNIALVMQEPILLPGTVAENIAFARPDATAAQIQAAAREAHADSFISQLPQGYETRVGEGAARLSTGEKQRINLARAFLKDAPILLLDEPTSALDTASEALVHASLQKLMRGRTTLIVAHRITTMQLASRMLTLENGQLHSSNR
jgi:ATP-binding cassette subfamily B protein/subfamily B ATP-binding cassette protein MsbA